MATIESKPLPPIGKGTVTITPADRTDLTNRARDVIYDYMFGNGSWWDAGPRKPWDQTVKDLQAFGEAVDASGQYIDDPDAILKSIREMIEDAIKQAQTNGKAVEDDIRKGLPDSNDRITIKPPEITDQTPPPQKLSISDTPYSDRPGSSGMTGDVGSQTLSDPAYPDQMRYLGTRIAASSRASAVDTGAPAVPSASSNQLRLAPTPPAMFNDRFGNLGVSTPGGAATAQLRPTAMSQAAAAPTIDKDARYLVRVPISPNGGDVVAPPANIANASALAQPSNPPGLFGGIPAPPYLAPAQAHARTDLAVAPGLDLNDWYNRWIRPLAS
jgi:hypothetical protein